MYPRTNYEMTDKQLSNLMDACKPVVCMAVGGIAPASPQENANRAWATLGEDMGFDSLTVQPIQSMGTKHFSAIPNETEDQRKDRISKENAKKDFDELINLESLIVTTSNRISELKQKAE